LPLYATILLISLVHAPYTAEARYTLPVRPARLVFVAITADFVLRSMRVKFLEGVPIVKRELKT
jgi:hypothetical protein